MPCAGSVCGCDTLLAVTIVASVDGSALGNPGPAGWAWYIDDDCWSAGGWPHGTNNMGELTAVLELLRQSEHLREEPLTVFCDSKYVINSITKWMQNWKRKGWKKADGSPVQNLEIMKALDAALAGRRVKFEWVKGHSGHALNEAADERANAAALAYQQGREPARGPGFSRRNLTAGGASRRAEPTASPRSGRTKAPEPDLFSVGDDLFAVTSDTASPGGAVSEGRPDVGSPGSARAGDPIATVVALERKLLSDSVRRDPDALADLLHPRFQEIGASGRLYSRDEIVRDLGPTTATLEVISASEPGPGLVLLLWRSVGERTALRSSLWTLENGRWQQLFHQGTPA